LFVAEPPEVDKTFEHARWLAETEKTMMRQERVAERVAVQKLRDLEIAETEQEDDDGFVFGDGGYDELAAGEEEDEANVRSVLSSYYSIDNIYLTFPAMRLYY